MAAKSKRRKETEPGGRPARPGGAQAKVFRRKSCLFCKDKVREVDYKNVEQLRRYTSERGKIRSRRMSGACRRHQRQIAVAIKRAREMALLPYVAEGGGPPSRSRSGERR
jgi:small subunit ribosomal protein S18